MVSITACICSIVNAGYIGSAHDVQNTFQDWFLFHAIVRRSPALNGVAGSRPSTTPTMHRESSPVWLHLHYLLVLARPPNLLANTF